MVTTGFPAGGGQPCNLVIATGSAEEQPFGSSSSSSDIHVWLVPHTHWDREWYLPFEQFRIRLAHMMDELLDQLEQDESLRFVLDGQAVILEDYLDLRPKQEERLRRLLSSGRLAAGPSYVLPDEFLVGPESLIRNLIMGRQLCYRHGARPMAVGYAPDTFGHVAQLPQILLGFGIDSFIFWRGLGDEADRLGAVFQWQGPDGSRLLTVRLLEGYANARDLGRWTRRQGWALDNPELWPEMAARRVAEFVQRWRHDLDISGIRDLLLANGVDHAPLQRDLQEMVAACRERLPQLSFRIASYEEYVGAVRDNTGELQTLSGELVGGREACVVRSVNSTRISLKQANEATERALFVAEALASLAWLRAKQGYSYPRDEFHLAWRELLRNHPHDSLPGCSLDEVHRDMEQRFRSAGQIAHEIQRDALAALAGVTPNPHLVEAQRETRSLVNVLPWRRTVLATMNLPQGLQGKCSLVAETPDGPLPVQLDGPRGQRSALVVAELPGFGATQIRLRAGDGPDPNDGARADGRRAIENGYYRVEAAPNGTLTVSDLRTGDRWAGLHWFEDEADRGDEYSFCPLENGSRWESLGLEARVRVRAAGPLVAELEIELPARLPRRLTRDRWARSRTTVSYPIRTVVRLTSGVDRIEFLTTVDNRAQDHRLRVRFPAPESEQSVRAEGHFALLRRPAQPAWDGHWREPPTKTHHTLGLVTAGKLALMSRGLPEYEAIPNDEGGVDLALTLLRCVGWLSWSDLVTRPGAEDPHLPTPEAQCPGVHRFEYAISLMGEEGDSELVRVSQEYRVGPVEGPAGIELSDALRIDGDGFAISAVKGAEEGDGVVVRLFNPGRETAWAAVSGGSIDVRRCRLDETHIEPDPVEVVSLRGGEIVTLRLDRRT